MKSNLVARSIIFPEGHFFVSGCARIESAQHLFLSCSTFGSLWPIVRFWVGFSKADAHSIPDVQFTYSAGGLRARRYFLQIIWLACVWFVWNERNHRFFRDAASPVTHLLDKLNIYVLF
jgi:hypothetical protein